MSTSAIVVIVVVAVRVAVAAVVLVNASRHRRLRSRFGPEYDRVLHDTDSRKAAEHELAQREQRHDQLELRPLPEQARQSFETDWSRLQEHFVDAPADAVAEADRLITAILAEIGYPTKGFDQQAADLSVSHADVVESYRRAHDVLANRTTDDDENGQPTDDLRRALLDYRAVFIAVIGRDRIATSHA